MAQQLQQATNQHAAQQILSRAQGQLNTLVGQVVSIKSMPDAAAAVSQQASTSKTSSPMTRVLQQDNSVANVVQSYSNGASNAAATTAVQLDVTAANTCETSNAACNGSGILVFQQKPATSTNNVPVLVIFLFFFLCKK